MTKTQSQATKLRNLILFSPHVLRAELVLPDTIQCRFSVLNDDMWIEVDSEGVARLLAKNSRSVLNLALGPINDCRSIARSLDYFLDGFSSHHPIVD